MRTTATGASVWIISIGISLEVERRAESARDAADCIAAFQLVS
jgi:hypothetical protein